MATCEIDQVLHLQKANLVKTAGKEINDVTIVGGTSGDVVIKLPPLALEQLDHRVIATYLDGLLKVLDVITIDVVVRANWLLQLGSNDMPGAFSGSTTCEYHDTPTSILERSLEQANRDTKSNARASQCTLVIGNRPRVTL